MADLKTRLSIDVETSGEDKVSGVASDLRDVGVAADETAPKLSPVAEGVRAAFADADAQPVTDGLSGVGEAAAQAGDALGQAGDQAAEAGEDLDRVGAASGSASGELEKVTKALVGLFALNKLKDFALDIVHTSDAYGQMADRIEQTTESSEEYELVQSRLLEIAQRNYKDLEGLQELYIRSNSALKSYGYGTSEVLDIMGTFNNLLTTNAASTDKANNAQAAYTNALQKGKIEADGWTSIMAAMPSLVDEIATSSGKSAAEIRALGASGKLSITELNRALLDAKERSGEAADAMRVTLNDAIVKLSNSWKVYVGESERAQAVTSLLVKSLGMIGQNLDQVVSLTTALVSVTAGLKAFEVGSKNATIALADGLDSAKGKVAAFKSILASAAAVVSAFTTGFQIGNWLREFDVVQQGLLFLEQSFRKIGTIAQYTWKMMKSPFSAGELYGELQDELQSLNQEYANYSAQLAKSQADEKRQKQINSSTAMSYQQVSDAIRSLTPEKAVAFASEIEKSFADGKISADELTEAYQQLAKQSLKNLSVDAADVFGTMSDKAREATLSVDVFADAAVKGGMNVETASKGIEAGLMQAFAAAQNSEDVDVMTERFRKFEEQGLLTEAAAARLETRLSEVNAKIAATPDNFDSFYAGLSAAFENGEISIEQFERAIDNVAIGALQQFGVSATEVFDGISGGARQSAAQFDLLTAALKESTYNGQQVENALEAAYMQALNSADSVAAVRALEQRLQGLYEQGMLSSEGLGELSRASEEARVKIEGSLPGIQSVEEAFKRLNVQSAASMRAAAVDAKKAFDTIASSGTATTQELKAAFQAWASEASRASVMTSGKLDETTKATMRAEAAAAGLSVGFSDSGEVMVKTSDESRDAVLGIGGAVDDANSKSLQGLQEELDGVKEEADGAQTSVINVFNNSGFDSVATRVSMLAHLSGALASVSEEAAEAADKIHQTAGSATAATDGIRNLRNGAKDLVSENVLGDMKSELADVTAELTQMRKAQSDPNLWWGSDGAVMIAERGDAIEVVKKALLATKQAQIEVDIATENFNRSVASGNLTLQEQEQRLRTLVRQAEQYGSQNLDGLKSALADVRQQMDDLKNASKDALDAIQDEWDAANGREVERLERKFAARQAELEAAMLQAQAEGDAEAVSNYREALSKLLQLKKLQVAEARQAQEQEKQQRDEEKKQKAAQEREEKAERDTRPAGGSGGNPPPAPVPAAQVQPPVSQTIALDLSFGGAHTTATVPDNASTQAFLQQLQRARAASAIR